MPAVPVHHTPTSSAAWDGPGQVAKLRDDYTEADLKDLFAWLPDEADPKKSECKFPHHQVAADGKPGAANIKGCEAVISVLNGGMGGADIPDADRQGVYDHVAAHLKDAGLTPAELKSAEAARLTCLSSGLASVNRIRAREGMPPMPKSALAERAALPHTVEQRSRPFRGVELREKPDGTGGSALVFTGYACVTEEPYEMQDWLGPFTEVVRSGAFTKTLGEGADVPFKINHEGMTLARTKSGTMRLAEDSTGLHVEADLDRANSQVRDLQSAMDRGDIDEMSFAFWVTRQCWSPDYDQRDILEVNLNKGDVSAVNYGANPNTAGATLHARELAAHLERLPADERREVFDRLAAEFQAAPVLMTRAQMLAWAKARAAELREGKTLSTDTLSTLQQVLDLVAQADTAVDEAQVVLSDLMGVPNPDDKQDEKTGNGDSGTESEAKAALDLYERRARLLAL